MGALADHFGAPMRILLIEDDPEITAEFTRTVDQSDGDVALVASTSNESEVAQLLSTIGVDCVFVAGADPGAITESTKAPWITTLETCPVDCPPVPGGLSTPRMLTRSPGCGRLKPADWSSGSGTAARRVPALLAACRSCTSREEESVGVARSICGRSTSPVTTPYCTNWPTRPDTLWYTPVFGTAVAGTARNATSPGMMGARGWMSWVATTTMTCLLS